MVQLIVGDRGKGKTISLLDKVNSEVKEALGSVVYIDKSTNHMYELNNRIRLINVSDFGLENTDQFIGFICGVISQDHDLELVYIDSFLKVAKLSEEADYAPVIRKIEAIGKKFDVNFTICISVDISDLPESIRDLVALSL
ncbi:MAG: twitching motility protein PilT [bacterium]